MLSAFVFIILIILGALLIGPFLVPVPALKDTVDAKSLAGETSQFLQLENVELHYIEQGSGDSTFILLHGFGASLFSWREVMAPLARVGRVIAYDRPAFGLTSRPLPGEWGAVNPYSPAAQVQQLIGLMDGLGIARAILVGNSAGGTIAIAAALEHPQRVSALILVDPAVYSGGGVPSWMRPIFNSPQFAHLGPLFSRQLRKTGDDFIRTAWHDPARISAEVYAGYRKPLMAHHWDIALWEFTRVSHPLDLTSRLAEINLPVLVITGEDDRIVPTAQTLRLASEIPGAKLAVIDHCGHVPHEEQPAQFMQVIQDFLTTTRSSLR